MLEKTYNPQEIEEKHYDAWEKAGAFEAGVHSHRKPFALMMPPPNVTGNLHIGHALTYTLQDILCRFKRMQGYDVLYQPGTDHAGIATQMVVERELDKKGIKRRDIGRDKFLEHVWAWKEQSGDFIVKQQRKLGVSADWKRSRFTLDEGLSLAVRKVFVELYHKGLIYRDKRLVNWDPQLQTAVSDLEVKNEESKGPFWYFKYPIAGKENEFITIATTRPETMFGDTAVAVHPEDERYRHLIGQHVLLPFVDRRIPIVADPYSDPEKGTGAVKITPAHDFNDFEVGNRHKLDRISVLDREARMNENAPPTYQGLDRFEARTKVVGEMEALGLLEKVEETLRAIPYGERSGVILEPLLTDQWFVDAAVLAPEALEAVEDGRTRLFPEHHKAVYRHWLTHIQPWCISRQLWWGHQIPAWYGPDGHIFVGMCEEEASAQAETHYGHKVNLTRDEDVLDTWFSSALWPFSTLGWPEKTPELERYYPTSVLVTGTDILFFWVARMMMMGLYFMKDVPFRTVYLNSLVRDEKGQKMSKTKGNVVDPLVMTEKYGADALRFTLAALSAPGRDINFAGSVVEGYRNFATKLWNAARFCEVNGCVLLEDFDPQTVQHPLNKWIVGELAILAREAEMALEEDRFDGAASLIYQGIWACFCDWYVEFAKPLLNAETDGIKFETRATAAWVLGELCHLLHPFMPFITEELWQHLTHSKNGLIMNGRWPFLGQDIDAFVDPEIKADVEWIIQLIAKIRGVRTDLNIPPGAWLHLKIKEMDEAERRRLETFANVVKRLARLEVIDFRETTHLQGAAQIVLSGASFWVPLGDVIDLNAEEERLQKSLKTLEDEIKSLERKLSNEDFTARAPQEVVQKNRNRLQELQDAHEKTARALGALKVA